MRWVAGLVVVELSVSPDLPVLVLSVSTLSAEGDRDSRAVPLVELDRLGGGRAGNSAGDQHRPYALTRSLRYQDHEAAGDRLTVRQRTADGLAVESVLEHVSGVLRIRHRVTNEGTDPVTLSYVSSLSLTGFGGELSLHEARNAWCAENRWQRLTLEQAGIVDNGEDGDLEGAHTSRARHTVTVAGSWSAAGSLPVGGITREDPPTAWVWQVEHSGAWHWETADLRGDLYLLVSGPTDREHQWRQTLSTGDSFGTVPVALAVVTGTVHDGLRALNGYRRATRRPSADNERLPVIFNDYMNCLWGDPTEEREVPLIAAAAEAGAEYFVIDAGWYSDDAGWWDTVGAWEPSPRRFPSGLSATLDRIRAAGMVPGLWLEPEVIGVNSPLVDDLPDAAYFQRGGRRVAENGRYHLDFRFDEVRSHLDGVVDRLVSMGVGYLKLDYNIVLTGTDAVEPAPGAGLLGHNRAYLAWLDGVLDRHPGLVLENCASGGMRPDHALLSRLALLSTSDQTDFRRYAPIAAAAPALVTPEQGAVWAYPQPGQSPEEVSFCLVNAMLGRVHLSGRLDLMEPTDRARVRRAMDVYKGHRALLAAGEPHWPLGLPGWYDPWVALAVATTDAALLAVWCRDPAGGTVTLPLPFEVASVTVAFPTDLPTTVDSAGGELKVTLPPGPSARLLVVDRHGP